MVSSCLDLAGIDKVLEGSKVHQLSWSSIWVESSWSSDEISTVYGVIEFMESGYAHITSIISVSNGDELSSLMVKELDIAIFGIA